MIDHGALRHGRDVTRRCSGPPGGSRLRVAAGLLIALGVPALTVGQFAAMRPRGTEQGLSGALHLFEGAAAMVLLLAAMGFAAVALGRGFALYTAGTCYSYQLWFIVLAIKLLREPSDTGEAA